MKDIIRWTGTPSKHIVVQVGQRAEIGADIVATVQISAAYSDCRKEGEEKGEGMAREVKRHDGDWGMMRETLTGPVVVLSFPTGLRDGFLGL